MAEKRKAAFGYSECAIIILIFGILAALIMPQLSKASAASTTLQNEILSLQSLLDLYKVQHNGLYPWQNTDGSVDLNQIVPRLTQRTNIKHERDCKDSAFGPYLTEVPQNPFVVDGEVVFAKECGVGVDWIIDVENNTVLDGRPEGGILGR